MCFALWLFMKVLWPQVVHFLKKGRIIKPIPHVQIPIVQRTAFLLILFAPPSQTQHPGHRAVRMVATFIGLFDIIFLRVSLLIIASP